MFVLQLIDRKLSPSLLPNNQGQLSYIADKNSMALGSDYEITFECQPIHDIKILPSSLWSSTSHSIR